MIKKFIILFSILFTPFCHANCWVDAGTKYSIDPWLLYSIAYIESGHNPNAININKNNSMDLGMMQVNSIWFPVLRQYGIKPSELLDGCNSIHVGAWILAHSFQTYGYNWIAVGAYHSQTPSLRDAYAIKVFGIYNRYRAYVEQQQQLYNSQLYQASLNTAGN